jgi:hypothetical protein
MRVLLLVALLGGCKTDDACQRAMDRIARIDAKRKWPAPTTEATRDLLASCRTGKYASYDPILRCAIDSPTDDAAADCMDKFIKAVLGASPKNASEAPKGLNPLLSQ